MLETKNLRLSEVLQGHRTHTRRAGAGARLFRPQIHSPSTTPSGKTRLRPRAVKDGPSSHREFGESANSLDF